MIAEANFRHNDINSFLDELREAKDKEKFFKDWLITGDKGVIEKDGWIKFIARDDDVITSAGYRIGPGPIEDCLMKHPSISMAAVIGKDDPLRTQIIKAFMLAICL